MYHQFDLAVGKTRSALRAVVDEGHDRTWILFGIGYVNVRIDGVVVSGDGLCHIESPSRAEISPAQQCLTAVRVGVEATSSRYLCHHSIHNLLSNAVPDFRNRILSSCRQLSRETRACTVLFSYPTGIGPTVHSISTSL